MVKKVKSSILPAPKHISFKNIITNNPGLLFYLLTVLFVTILFVLSISIGGITWDEVYSLPTIGEHFSAAFNNIALIGNPEDQHLIYYGIINLMPGYLLYQLFGEYHICSHIAIFCMSIVTSYYISRIVILLGGRHNLAYLTGALLLLYPIWLGHSFFNDKDFPSAVFYTIYSYYVCSVLSVLSGPQKISISLFIKLIISGALLAGTKFAFFPVVILNSLVIIMVFRGNVIAKSWLFIRIIAFTMLMTIIFTPGAWHQPIVYMLNDINLMSKFNWFGCTRLLNECIVTNSPQWSAARYLFFWYLVQTPLLFIILFTVGIISIIKGFFNKNDYTKMVWLILLGQLLFIPVLTMLRNSTLYDATRHTLFCIPIIVIISGFGLNFIYNLPVLIIKMVALCVIVLLLLILAIDNVLLNPYQYSYFNEISRQYITDKNTDTDYWGFSMRETFTDIDMMKYYTPYVSMENGPMPSTLRPFMVGEYQFVHYDKNMQMPPNASVNVIGLTRGNEIDSQINPDRCVLAAETTRALLFKSERLIMSKAYHCN